MEFDCLGLNPGSACVTSLCLSLLTYKLGLILTRSFSVSHPPTVVSHSKQEPVACACVLNRFCYVQLFATLWILAFQAPLSQGFSRQNYWSRLPCPPPGVLPHPGIELISLTSPALAGRFFPTSATWEAQAESGNTYKSQKSINIIRGKTLSLPQRSDMSL